MPKFKVIKRKEEVDFLKMSKENRLIYLHSFFKNKIDATYFNDLIDEDISERRLRYQQYKFFWENEGISSSLNFINENYRMIFMTGEPGLFEYDITSKTIVLNPNGESGTISKGKIILDSILIPKKQSDLIYERLINDFWKVREIDHRFMVQLITQILDVYITTNVFIPIKIRSDVEIKVSDIYINNKSRGYQSELVPYDNEVSDSAIPIYASNTFSNSDDFSGTSNEISDPDIIAFIEILNDLNFLVVPVDIHQVEGIIYNHYLTIINDYTKHIEDINIMESITGVLKIFTVLLYLIDQVIEERAKVNGSSDLAAGFKESYKNKKAVNRTTYYMEYVIYIVKAIKNDEFKKFKRYFDNPLKTLMYLYHTYISTNMQHFPSDYKKIIITNDTDFADILMRYYKYHNIHSDQDSTDFKNIFIRFDNGDKETYTPPKPFDYGNPTLLKTKKYHDIHKGPIEYPFIYKTKAHEIKLPKEIEYHINKNGDSLASIRQIVDILRKNYVNDISDKMLDEIGIPWKTIREDNKSKENFYDNARMFVESMNYKFHLEFRIDYDIIINKTYDTAKTTFYNAVYAYVSKVKNKQVILVGDFLRSILKFATLLDISEFDVESKKIKNEMIKIARTNIFYNLTPEYKIQIGFENLTQDKKEELLDRLIEEKKQKLKELTTS